MSNSGGGIAICFINHGYRLDQFCGFGKPPRVPPFYNSDFGFKSSGLANAEIGNAQPKIQNLKSKIDSFLTQMAPREVDEDVLQAGLARCEV